MGSCDIYLTAILHEMLKLFIHDMSLKITTR